MMPSCTSIYFLGNISIRAKYSQNFVMVSLYNVYALIAWNILGLFLHTWRYHPNDVCMLWWCSPISLNLSDNLSIQENRSSFFSLYASLYFRHDVPVTPNIFRAFMLYLCRSLYLLMSRLSEIYWKFVNVNFKYRFIFSWLCLNLANRIEFFFCLYV